MAEHEDVATDLADLDAVSLADVAETARDGEETAETLRRVAPGDGARLLVAASFNSAI